MTYKKSDLKTPTLIELHFTNNYKIIFIYLNFFSIFLQALYNKHCFKPGDVTSKTNTAPEILSLQCSL